MSKRTRTRPPSNEIAQAVDDELRGEKWTTPSERKKLGSRLLALNLASGMPTTEAIQAVCDHEWMRSDKGRGPHRSTVFAWLKEVTWADIPIGQDETGRLIEIVDRLDVDEQRRRYLGRVEASIMAWTAQRKTLAAQMKADDSIEAQTEIHAAMERCERRIAEYIKIGAQLLHIDKIPPLERLDEPETRRMLRHHIERSLGFFTSDERQAGGAMFTEETEQADELAAELRRDLIQ
jgi:hypothetical protein